MTAKSSTPRSIIGLILIALFLGATPLMLWMGRWRLALAYLLLGVLLLIAFFGAIITGVLPMPMFAGVDPATAAYLPHLLLAVAGLVQAFAIRRQALKRPWYSRWYVALPSLTVFSLAIAFLIRTFLFQPFSTPSASMEPSLMLGDFFFVSKTAYFSRDPERGEIAVFRLPADPDIVYVKRVIGLPGERIQMKDGVLYINEGPTGLERVELDPIFTQNGTASLSREALPNGMNYVVADTEAESPGDSTEAFRVPEGHYFVMGDNRDNSQDSRYPQVGFVPRANFVGPFALRFWNSEGIPLDNRP